MSWGERSCKYQICPIPEECNMATCNVNCRMYEWDGKTQPDSQILEASKEASETK